MKKLLLVLLVPVLVLGVFGCGGFETDTEVDAYLQGLWTADTAGGAMFQSMTVQEDLLQLVITPNEMTVRYYALGKVESVPFNIQFNRATRTRYVDMFAGATVGQGLTNLKAWEALGAADTASAAVKVALFDSLVRNFNRDDLARMDGVLRTEMTAALAAGGTNAAGKVRTINAAAVALGALNTVATTDVNAHLIAGTLLISDYRTAQELGNAVVMVSSVSADNLADEQSLIILGINYSDDVPWYMLSVPIQVGVYGQNL